MSKKDAYVQKLQAQMNEWKAEIDKLKAKADGLKADLRIGYYQKIDELRAKHKKVQKIVEDLRQAGDNSWESLKVGVDNASSELGSAVKSAVDKFR